MLIIIIIIIIISRLLYSAFHVVSICVFYLCQIFVRALRFSGICTRNQILLFCMHIIMIYCLILILINKWALPTNWFCGWVVSGRLTICLVLNLGFIFNSFLQIRINIRILSFTRPTCRSVLDQKIDNRYQYSPFRQSKRLICPGCL